MSSELRIAYARTGAVPTAWRVMPRAHWPNEAVGSPLWRPCIDLIMHRESAATLAVWDLTFDKNANVQLLMASASKTEH